MLCSLPPCGEPRLFDDLGVSDESEHSLGDCVGAGGYGYPVPVNCLVEVPGGWLVERFPCRS